MKTPLSSNRRNISLASQQKLDEREAWHKLVVKVLSWQDHLAAPKITPKEWRTYYQRMIKINVTYGRQKVMQNLRELRQLIKNHNGFA